MGAVQQNEEARRKTKVRKSGPSLLSKTQQLGKLGNVFALCVYWDPTKCRYAYAMHIPKNGRVPKMDSIANRLISARPSQRERRMTRSVRKDAAPKQPATDEIAVEVDGDQVVGFISQDDDEISMAALEPRATHTSPESQPDRGLRSAGGQSQSPLSSAASLHGPAAEDDADASGEEAEPSPDGINASPDVQPDSGPDCSEGVENAPAERRAWFPGKAWRDQARRLLRLLDEAQMVYARDQQPQRLRPSIMDIIN
ncbi:hypothetical protein B0T10DRAFT_502006 [Thelonectria olida]|uniref:Uncharacterized protein n=1 Tax=Thelonectria olida TaxID=1576542 RepID=A0A9P8VMG4_9HYPO|nr:hypothetical protein B0T10DRAFT_502006 [Thelonectria olida]